MGKRRDEGNDVARTVRLQELIREEVSFLLRNEVRDPRLAGVDITMVELASDGSRARLWYTVDDEDERVGEGELCSPEPFAGGAGHSQGPDRKEAWERATGFLRTRLAESLGLKRTPELRFRRDPAT